MTIISSDSSPADYGKGLGAKETEGTLVFEVATAATKTEVKQAVETLFKVKVDGVRTANLSARNDVAASSRAIVRTGKRRMCA